MIDTEEVSVSLSIGELKEAYINSYQVYIKAYQSGDPVAVREAMAAYRTSLQTFNEAQANIMTSDSVLSGDDAINDSPAAASDTESNVSDSDTSTDSRTFVPVNNTVTDRLGRIDSRTTGTTRNSSMSDSRRSFH